MAEPRPPDLLDRAWRALADATTAPLGTSRRADVVVLVGLVVVALLLASAPVLYLDDMPLDVFVPLDGAWRMMAGQRPHADFVTPLGSLWYWLLGAAAALTGGDPRLVVVASLLFAPVVAVLAWIAARDRLPEPLRGLLVAYTTLVALSPRTLDGELVGHNASYNRFGWALSIVGLTLGLLVPEGAGDRVRPLDVGAIAVTLALLFEVKVTYVGLVVGGLLVALVAAPRNRRTVALGLAVGLAAVLVDAVLPSGRLYLADLKRAAEAASGGPGLVRMDRLGPELDANRPVLVASVVLGFLLSRTSRGPEEEREAGLAAVAVLAVTAGALVVTSQSNDHTIPALVVALALVVASARERARARGGGPDGVLLGSAVVLFAVLALGVLDDARAALRYASGSRSADTVALVPVEGSLASRIRVPGPIPDEKRMVDLVVDGTIPGDVFDNLATVTWNVDDPVILADAVDLLRRHGLDHAKVTALTFSAPFPYTLGAPPPRGLPAWWDWRRTFGPADHDRAAETLADCDAVLVPEVWNIEGTKEVYGDALAEGFEDADRTPLWTLWVRRSR